jgi:SAM-dependent methyltransferase
MSHQADQDQPASPYPASYFQRYDPTDDRLFYRPPRKVVHLDDSAIRALGAVYAELLPRSGTLLDLMSSWRTHLPAELASVPNLTVVGLGLNTEELADNPQLAHFLLHDLNRQPQLPFPNARFDAAMCAVSIQYLTRPIEVFAELARVLKPGAPFLVSFSNRCFPTKAVAIWHNTTDQQHVQLVESYFRLSRGWDEPQVRLWQPEGGDPLYVVWAIRRG